MQPYHAVSKLTVEWNSTVLLIMYNIVHTHRGITQTYSELPDENNVTDYNYLRNSISMYFELRKNH